MHSYTSWAGGEKRTWLTSISRPSLMLLLSDKVKRGGRKKPGGTKAPAVEAPEQGGPVGAAIKSRITYTFSSHSNTSASERMR